MSTILVVDDEVAVRELLRKVLEKTGHEVTAVPTGDQSLELLSKQPFDLVLLDVRLAQESGIALLRK